MRKLGMSAVVVGLLAFGDPAVAAIEPLGHETVETRPLRNPKPKAGREHRHRHDHGAHRHGHSAAHAGHRQPPGDHHRGHRHGADHAHGPGDRQRHAHAPGQAHDHGLETENLFGFTLGSDTEHAGAKGLALETVGRFGKRDGTYAGVSKKLEFSYGVTNDISAALGLFGDYHRVAGVTGFDDVQGFNFNGIGGEVRWRLLRRGPSPFGLTLHIEPSVQRVDELTGLRGIKYGAENKLILDTELVKERVFAAFNAIYEIERVRESGSADWESGSKIGSAFAATVQVMPKNICRR